jgi:hypothetical protein
MALKYLSEHGTYSFYNSPSSCGSHEYADQSPNCHISSVTPSDFSLSVHQLSPYKLSLSTRAYVQCPHF